MGTVLSIIMSVIFIVVVAAVVIVVAFGTFFVVRQQTDAVVERLGKYHRIVGPGFHIKVPIIDRLAARVSLQVQQIDLQLESKTLDNVFVTIVVAVQYRVMNDRVREAFYTLEEPERQIKGYVFDAIRSSVPSLKLDDLFSRKDDIAQNVSDSISSEMGGYGYDIIKTLIIDIAPDSQVKAAMNRINAAQRERVAAQDLAEADRIRVVTEARADAESKQLQGQGIANQRLEIVNGLTTSFDELRKTGIDENEVTQLLLLTQYFDTLAILASSGNLNTVLLPGSPGAVSQFSEELRQAIITGSAAVQPPERRSAGGPHGDVRRPPNRRPDQPPSGSTPPQPPRPTR